MSKNGFGWREVIAGWRDDRALRRGAQAQGAKRANAAARSLAQFARAVKTPATAVAALVVACGAIGFALSWSLCVGAPGGQVWVNWPALRGSIAQASTLRVKKEGQAQGAGLEASAAALAETEAGKWDGQLGGSAQDKWRSASTDQILDAVSTEELAACFRAKACARLSAGWRDALAATVGFAPAKWAPTPGAADPGLSPQDLAQISKSAPAPHFWRILLATLAGGVFGALWGNTLRKGIDAARNEAGERDAVSWMASLAHCASVWQWIAAVGGGTALICALIGGLAEGKRGWLAPASGSQAQAAMAGRLDSLGGVEWTALNEDGLAILIAPAINSLESKTRYERDDLIAIQNACEARGACVRRRGLSAGDIAREALGRPAESGVLTRVPAQDAEIWARRDQTARRSQAQLILAFVVCIFLFCAGAAGALLLDGLEERCGALRQRFETFGAKGRVLEEARMLAAEAKRAARRARRKRKAAGETAKANKKAANRL
jgi:hypothetical protein